MVELVDVAAAILSGEAELVLSDYPGGAVSRLAGDVVAAGGWGCVLKVVEAGDFDSGCAGELQLCCASVEAEGEGVDAVVCVEEDLIKVVDAEEYLVGEAGSEDGVRTAE
jgi:hypothetical protein